MSDADDLQLRVSAEGGVARAELSRVVTIGGLAYHNTVYTTFV